MGKKIAVAPIKSEKNRPVTIKYKIDYKKKEIFYKNQKRKIAKLTHSQ